MPPSAPVPSAHRAAPPDAAGLDQVRALLLDPSGLVRAAASGARRGSSPRLRRVRLRPVRLAAGLVLQVEGFDERQSFTSNHPFDDAGPQGAAAAVDGLLAEGFGHWHVESAAGTLALRYSAKGRPLLRSGPPTAARPVLDHDRPKTRLLDEGHPVLAALGIADAQGRIKPTRRAKHRQVEQFLALLDTVLPDPAPADGAPVRIVDLGCGNAYLTLCAVAWLEARGVPVEVVGVDLKAQALAHNERLAEQLGWSDRVRFVQAAIADAPLDVAGRAPDVVVALHACDTATDDALAFAVRSGARAVLAAPCCHHDLQRQLHEVGPPDPYALITRHGILRERFADVLTDALRAHVLRLLGMRVDVMEFVDGEHTPRNLMIRGVLTAAPASAGLWDEYDSLVSTWRLEPVLAAMLHGELGRARP